jgi:hypothetical protein
MSAIFSFDKYKKSASLMSPILSLFYLKAITTKKIIKKHLMRGGYYVGVAENSLT